MRIIIDIADGFIDEWGTVIISPAQLKIEESTILLPGFKYRVPKEKNRTTFLIRTFVDGVIPPEYEINAKSPVSFEKPADASEPTLKLHVEEDTPKSE